MDHYNLLEYPLKREELELAFQILEHAVSKSGKAIAEGKILSMATPQDRE